MYKEKERRRTAHEVLRIPVASGQLFLKFVPRQENRFARGFYSTMANIRLYTDVCCQDKKNDFTIRQQCGRND
jgi:hypothetical protein